MITLSREDVKATYPNAVWPDNNISIIRDVTGRVISRIQQSPSNKIELLDVNPSVNELPRTTDSDGPLQL